jgi:hypothetical protein
VTVSIDELGPVAWIVVEFPGAKLADEIAPIITDYVDRGLIKVLDLVFLKKDEDSGLEAFEASGLGAAVRHAGGQLAASGRIPVQAVLAAIEADAGEGA